MNLYAGQGDDTSSSPDRAQLVARNYIRTLTQTYFAIYVCTIACDTSGSPMSARVCVRPVLMETTSQNKYAEPQRNHQRVRVRICLVPEPNRLHMKP